MEMDNSEDEIMKLLDVQDDEEQEDGRITFSALCNRYKVDVGYLTGDLEKIYNQLGMQGWNVQKWAENETSIRLAVFLWVCDQKMVST